MLKDFILVIAGIVVFMIPAILQKGRRSQLKNDFPCQLSKMAVLSGLFVSIVELVVLIADLENVECTENGDGTLTWVIGYRFITAGTFDVKVECRGDSWEDCSSKTVTATIYNTAKELANATA